MKYFVVSDPHGYFTILKNTLDKAGFDKNNANHKLIICGDLMDRGLEPVKMQEFVLEMFDKNKLILIRGNHEDLMMDFLNRYKIYFKDVLSTHHYYNGTVDTALNLAKDNWIDNLQFLFNPDGFVLDARRTKFVTDIIPKSVDYFETERFVFVHGWIPCDIVREKDEFGFFADRYVYNKDWRNASEQAWQKARWLNGQRLAKEFNIIEPNKTIVCGHYTCSFGHSEYEKKGTKFDGDADFTPYYSNGIIAIDACAAQSRQINCIVIDD